MHENPILAAFAALICILALGVIGCQETTLESPTAPEEGDPDGGNGGQNEAITVTFSCTPFEGKNIQCSGDTSDPVAVTLWSYSLFRGELFIRSKTGQTASFSTADQPDACGTFTVRLEVTLGERFTLPDPPPPVAVTIPESECATPVDPPRAAIGFSVDGLTVNFQDLSSGEVTSRLWLYGDGGSSTSTNPSHTYTSGGNKNVSLEVTGPGGSDEASETISLLAPPTARFSFSTSGLEVFFTDTSDGEVDRWEWSFGDGSSSNAQNPAHTYAAGTYTVTLVVRNTSGQSSFTDTVTVP